MENRMDEEKRHIAIQKFMKAGTKMAKLLNCTAALSPTDLRGLRPFLIMEIKSIANKILRNITFKIDIIIFQLQ